MSTKPDYSYLHRRVGDLAAEINREKETEPARARKLQQWERTADDTARKAKSDTAAALAAYVRVCGYSPESERLMLFVMAATRGEDGLTCAPDWMMGAYLDNLDAAEMEALRPLPTKDREKRSLAQKWKRAWDGFNLEQKRARIVAIKRLPGSMNQKTGKGRASEIYALFVQDLVEIEREARGMRGVRRYERFDRAAQIVVERKRGERPHPPEFKPDARRTRLRAPETTATRLNRCLHSVREKIAELIKGEIAAGATPDDVHALAETLLAAVGEVVAESAPSSLEDLTLIQGSSKPLNEVANDDKSDAHFENTFCENTEENRKTEPFEVFKFEDLDDTPPDASPDAEMSVEIATAEAENDAALDHERAGLPDSENDTPPDTSPPLELYDEDGNFHLPATARATLREIEEARRRRHLE